MEGDYTYCVTINWMGLLKVCGYILIGGIVVFVVLIRGIFGD